MQWQAVTYYQPFMSPKKRLALSGGIILMAAARCLLEFFEKGFTPTFWLYGGLALASTMLEWRNYNKPRQISLNLQSGRLEYSNAYTSERHTVYQSRTYWIKEESDALIFYGESSIATRIPIQHFSEEQLAELKTILVSWNKKMVPNGTA